MSSHVADKPATGRPTINLDAVTFVDAHSLGALLVAYRDVTRAKGSLVITANRLYERLLARVNPPPGRQ